jgi:hypothetical protein
MKRRRLFAALLAIAAGVLGAHVTVRALSRIDPPRVTLPSVPTETSGAVRRSGPSWAKKVGKIWEVHLEGTPEELGAAHARLLYDDMVETERVVWTLLERNVRNAAARVLLLDLAGFAYRNVDGSMPEERRRELAASALAFRPDPFEDRFDTFQRFVYLTALYDISLAYERSPLVGCTTFTFSGGRAKGSPLLARAFDFDVDDVFDEKKAVFLVKEEGRIPFASVAWPGLVGVVSGMNVEGLAVVVHGARAGPTRTTGEPVVFELRRLLSRASTTDDALRALRETDPLVSHVLVLTDRDGHAVAVERVPGAAPFVRELGDRAAVTNHLEGPFASDPKNLRVREISSTLARKARGDELVRELDHAATAEDAVRLLRDRKGAGGTALPLGDRRAIDALIATHGIVAETATRRLWVSEAPHLLDRFVAFDLPALFAETGIDDTPHAEIAPDPMLTSGAYTARP